MRPVWDSKFSLEKYGNFPNFKFRMGFWGFIYKNMGLDGGVYLEISHNFGVFCILIVFKQPVFFNCFFFHFPSQLRSSSSCSSLVRFLPPLDSNSFAKFTRRDPTHSSSEEFGKLNLNPETKNLQFSSSSTRIGTVLFFFFFVFIL